MMLRSTMMNRTTPEDYNYGRNLTGLYLGVDGCSDPPQSRKIIPNLTRTRYIPSKRAKTPTEKRRYKKVEQLRVKEEKRGFVGQSLKPKEKCSSEAFPEPDFYQQFPVNFWDMTRQTGRHFTAATNSGVTHFERLRSQNASSYEPTIGRAQSESDAVIHHVESTGGNQRNLSGMHECYRKICKGNIETLYSLLPQKRTRVHETSEKKSSSNQLKYTGFAVKGYRNPNAACIMATFCEVDGRAKTASGPNAVSGTLASGLAAPCSWRNVQSERVAVSAGPIKVAAEQAFKTPGVILLPPPLSRGLVSHHSRPLNTPCDITLLPGSPAILKRHLEPTGQNGGGVGVQAVQAVQHATGLLKDSSTRGIDHSGARAAPSRGADSTWNSVLESKPKPLTVKSAALSGRPLEGSTVESRERLESERATGTKEPPSTDDSPGKNPADTLTGRRTDDAEGSETKEGREEVANDAEEGPADTMNAVEMAQPYGTSRLMKTASGADILIGLEDESGTQKPVEIDVVDATTDVEDPSDVAEVGGIRRRVSITERILNMRNSEEQMLCLTETAETRKQELANLLDEHAHLVAQVSTMEVSRDVQTSHGANKENSAFPALAPAAVRDV